MHAVRSALTAQDLVFAYLAVFPQTRVLPIDVRAHDPAAAEREVLMRVESVRCGDVRAKMQAIAQPDDTQGWRILCGFYVDKPLWHANVQPVWAQAAAHGHWERALRVGLRLAHKFTRPRDVFVRASAHASPPSLLLSLLQALSGCARDAGRANDATLCSCPETVSLREEFWTLVCSSTPLAALTLPLMQLTHSWNALTVSARTPDGARAESTSLATGAPLPSPTAPTRATLVRRRAP